MKNKLTLSQQIEQLEEIQNVYASALLEIEHDISRWQSLKIGLCYYIKRSESLSKCFHDFNKDFDFTDEQISPMKYFITTRPKFYDIPRLIAYDLSVEYFFNDFIIRFLKFMGVDVLSKLNTFFWFKESKVSQIYRRDYLLDLIDRLSKDIKHLKYKKEIALKQFKNQRA